MRTRQSLIVSALVVSGLAATGCDSRLGEPNTWVPWDEIGGELQPEVSTAPSEAVPGDSLRIVTFNVKYGADTEALARAFRENAALATADVLLLQEIRSFPEEGSSRAARLAQALGGLSYVYAPARTLDPGTHGLAILSRFALEDIKVMELPHAALPIGEQRRIALSVDLRTSAGLLRIINVHLDTRMNADERVLQLRPVAMDPPPLAIVGGDFNSNPMVWAFNAVPVLGAGTVIDADQARILDDYMTGEGFQNPTAELGPTVSVPGLAPHLDSIYVHGAVGSAAGVEREVDVSDHWPMWLDLRLGP